MERACAPGKALFVIPSVNGGALLERMLPSLSLPANAIVIIDQGSTDSTEKICARHGVRILQLGSPVTYTRACNVGIELARKRGCEFVFLANNDIVFLNDVANLLMEEMLADPRLAIVAPSQQIIDNGEARTAYRVKWDLTNLAFDHDFQAPIGRDGRIESDFCELTCALVRIAALDAVGDLDEEYGFYHEDADLCFRLRQHGYSCAYLSSAQIAHYHSSTMTAQGERKNAYLTKNKKVFARKFGGFGVNHADHGSTATNSWNVINRHLHRYIRAYGMLDLDRPELLFSHPGVQPPDYLYTAWETTRLPRDWRNFTEAYRGVFATSRWCCDVLLGHGFDKVKFVPLGVETDVFQAEGPFERLFDETTFLWFANNQYRKGLDVMLRAWRAFRSEQPKARLVVMGQNISELLSLRRGGSRIWGGFAIHELRDQNIVALEVIAPLADHDLAAIYRAIDVCVVTSRSEGFGFVIAEAMACGKLVIFPKYSGCSEFLFDGALAFSGTLIKSDYSDKGFDDVGFWWEPDVSDLLGRMHEAHAMTDADRRRLGAASIRHIRNGYTWRDTCFHLRAALVELQEPKPARIARMPAPAGTAVTQEPGSPLDFAGQVEAELQAKALTDIEKENPTYARAFQGFDQNFYLSANPDVAAAGFSPFQHFIDYGWKEGRRPSPHFSAKQLIAANPDARRLLLQRSIGPDLTRDRKRGPLPLPLSLFRKKLQPREPAVPLPAAANRRLPLFVGYAEAALGLGESTRGMLRALNAAGVEFSIYPLNKNVETRLIGPFMPERYDLAGPHDLNVFEVSPDQLPLAIDLLGRESLLRSYNVLRAYCELPRAPEAWKPLISQIHEIWAPTRFVAESFRYIFDGPIEIIPPHVDVTLTSSFGRAHFGLKEDVFYFIFSFDYYSMPSRKNPLAVLEAFLAAFGDEPDSPVALIIKSVGPSELNPAVKAALEAGVARGPIVLLEDSMTRDEMVSLLACADCYVSLHRSEGFGLGMAEAMAMRKAVIGTGYSGNDDFLTQETGYPIGFTLRKIKDGEYYWGDRQSWAEPDLAMAAKTMRQVYRDVIGRKEKACAARELMLTRFGAANVAALASERIRQILQAR